VAGCRGSRTSGHSGTASQRSRPRTGPCSGCYGVATGLPPRTAGLPDHVPAPRWLGNALTRTLRLASPIRPPRGPGGRHRRRCALPVPLVPITPIPPHEGALPIAALLDGSGCAAPAGSWGGLPRRPGRPLNRGRRPPQYTGLFSLRLALCGLSFRRAWLHKVMPEGSCVKARPRCARPSRTTAAVWLPARARGCAQGPRCWRTAGAGPARA